MICFHLQIILMPRLHAEVSISDPSQELKAPLPFPQAVLYIFIVNLKLLKILEYTCLVSGAWTDGLASKTIC